MTSNHTRRLDCKILVLHREPIVASWGSSDIHVIVEYGDESVFPNLRIALQMMLTMGVSIASW